MNWESERGSTQGLGIYCPFHRGSQGERGQRSRSSVMGTREAGLLQSPGLEGGRVGREPVLEKQEVWTWSLVPAPEGRMGIPTRESDPPPKKRGL